MKVIAMDNVINTSDCCCRRVNQQLTQSLICLHAKGYELDFSLLKNRVLLCLQTGECFDEESLSVTVVDQVYDFITCSYKYIHIIETACGARGILLIEGIYRFHLKVNTIQLPLSSILQKTA